MQEGNDMAGTMRRHKDTVFRMLFWDKKHLLELYNALNGTEHSDEEELEVYTLENSIYMNVKNDVSLLFDGELHLFEHQASINPNLPLRDPSYVTRQLERYTKDESLYGRRLVRIPGPRFVVFYNGTEEQPEQSMLKLSDAFLKKTEHPELELKVQMININYGKNRELMERCRTLEGYSILVSRIRSHAKELPMDEAVDLAVTECIRDDILAAFLSRQRAEVKAMSIFEYDEERERRLLQKSYWEDGRDAGREEGIAIGEVSGRSEGRASGTAESLLKLLSRLGEVDEVVRGRILEQKDTECLAHWFDLALESESVEEFVRKAGKGTGKNSNPLMADTARS